jgi:hypothetical protein
MSSPGHINAGLPLLNSRINAVPRIAKSIF